MEIKPPTHLTFYQKEIIFSPARFTVTQACTKAGKTLSHIIWLFGKAMEGPPEDWEGEEFDRDGENYWWVAPVYGQAKIAFKRLRKYLRGADGFRFHESELYIETPLRSFIYFKSAEKTDNLYGDDVYAAVFDEFTRAREEAWVALRSTLTATGGSCKLIGNYLGKKNWGNTLAEKAKSTDPEFSHYAFFRVTADDAIKAGVLSQEEVNEAEKDLPRADFKRLYKVEEADVEGALWTSDMIDEARVNEAPNPDRIVIALDPSANDGTDGDECGIVGAGVVGNMGYVLVDASGMYSPEGWGKRAVQLYHELQADMIVGEKNNGGEMVRTIIKQIDSSVPVRLVHASRGKKARAEPISFLYEQKRVKHLGVFPDLEDEQTSWIPGKGHSPNRIDALVWALNSLMIKRKTTVKRGRK